MPVDPVGTVASGYDRLGGSYLEWAGRIEADPRTPWLDRLESRLADGSAVLDLGCGAGIPTAARLAERHALLGVDASAGQIERARSAVPKATFRVGDMTVIDLPASSFDAVVALYSIIHVPRLAHAALFRSIATWIRPGGWLLAALGGAESEDWAGDWLGVPMFFSSWAPDETLRLLSEAGFEIVEADVVEIREPEGGVPFLWVLARRPLDEPDVTLHEASRTGGTGQRP